jgi:hypothetical protein
MEQDRIWGAESLSTGQDTSALYETRISIKVFIRPRPSAKRVESTDSLTCSREPVNGTYPEPGE